MVAVALGGILFLPAQATGRGSGGHGATRGNAAGFRSAPAGGRARAVFPQARHYNTFSRYRGTRPRWNFHHPRYAIGVSTDTGWYGNPYYHYYPRQRYTRTRYINPYGIRYYTRTRPVYQGAYYTIYDTREAVPVVQAELPPIASSLAMELQLVLRRLGYYHGPIDGIIGGGTWRAIRAYRRSTGLPVINRVDPPLLRSLGFGDY